MEVEDTKNVSGKRRLLVKKFLISPSPVEAWLPRPKKKSRMKLVERSSQCFFLWENRSCLRTKWN